MDDAAPTRRRGAALLAGGIVMAGALLVGTPVAYAEDASVAATGNNTFAPARVAVLVGDTVTWSTTGGVNHTVTSSSANWRKDNQISLVGQSTTFTFSRAGAYAYYCRTHGSPTAGMRGTVVVSAPVQPSPTRTTATPKPTPKPSASASPTRTPTLRPTPSRTPSPRATPSPAASASRSVSPTPAPSRSSAPSPTGVQRSASLPPPPAPSLAESPDVGSPAATVDLGSGGLGPRASTGRGRGLPTFLALVALTGVVSAQVRALLSLPPAD